MIFNDHYNLRGMHAFLSASNYHWLNYDDDKLVTTYYNRQLAVRGTELHAYASEAIRLGIKQARSPKTLNMYINDAIGFRMKPEQTLFYSPNAFGTTDAIGFKNDFLRIHDLKTGITPVSMQQNEVYVALFCLEYRYKPGQITAECRIYQDDDIDVHIPEVDKIAHIMDRIVTFDKMIERIKSEEQG